MDYNFSGRTDFKNHTSVHTKHLHHPGKSKFRFNLKDNQIIATSRLIVNCIAGYSNGVPFAPEPRPTITIAGLIDNQPCGVGTVFNFNPYLVPTQYELIIDSPAFFQIEVIFYGCLYTFKEGRSISHKEAIGFAMQGANRQGMIVLDEGAFDSFNEYIVSIGGPDFRSLPFSMEAIKQMPDILQHAIVNKIMTSTKTFSLQDSSSTIKALPSPSALSEFLSDALNSGISLETKELKALANHMLESGWAKRTTI